MFVYQRVIIQSIKSFLQLGGGSLNFQDSSIRSCQVNLWEVQPVSLARLKSAMLRRTPFWRRGQRPPPEVPMMDVFVLVAICEKYSMGSD